MSINTLTRRKRKATSCPPDIFGWAQDASLLTSPAIRAIVRRAQVSPAIAAVIFELSGYGRETADV
ncbi:hypothetical protein MAE02_63160 [Microvirga aerophila]|uniref:Uncharacterized protein n=1 Tax=Microvirga aerophila TaxID=670291 RepID=A0A512C330_9HYPH|nr:hypothetical protein MAE02_63160 [Microvirga aerophila]